MGKKGICSSLSLHMSLNVWIFLVYYSAGIRIVSDGLATRCVILYIITSLFRGLLSDSNTQLSGLIMSDTLLFTTIFSSLGHLNFCY